MGLFLIVLAIPLKAWAATENEHDLCEALNKMSSDVTYQPGIDIHGNPVKSAAIQSRDTSIFSFPLTLSLAHSLGLSRSSYPSNSLGSGTEVNIGQLDISAAQVLLNGKPLSDEDKLSLLNQCHSLKP